MLGRQDRSGSRRSRTRVAGYLASAPRKRRRNAMAAPGRRRRAPWRRQAGRACPHLALLLDVWPWQRQGGAISHKSDISDAVAGRDRWRVGASGWSRWLSRAVSACSNRLQRPEAVRQVEAPARCQSRRFEARNDGTRAAAEETRHSSVRFNCLAWDRFLVVWTD